MSDSRLVRWLLRLYPTTWRRRFGREISDILADRPLTPTIVVDVVLGAIDARWNGGRSAGIKARTALLGWWVVTHIIFGATAMLAIRTVAERPLDLLATVIAAVLLASVGQWLILRRFLGRVGWWVPATMARSLCGLALTFVAQNFRWYRGTLAADTILFAGIVLCVSASQWLVLRRGRPGAGWWPLAGAIGGLAIIPTFAATLTILRFGFPFLLAFMPPGRWFWVDQFAPGILLLRGAMVAAVYALVTGAVLLRLYRSPSSEREPTDLVALAP